MILGLIEHDRGDLNKASLEMLTLARGLAGQSGDSLAAVIVGAEGQALVEELTAYGIDKVYLIRHERLDEYAPEAWAQCLTQLAEQLQPQAIMASGTDRGNEVMAHLAARTNLPLATNCVEVEPGEVYALTRLRWGGSLLEEANLQGSPKLLTIAPLAIAPEETTTTSKPDLEVVEPVLQEADFLVRVLERSAPETEGVSLADAQVVVGGGRGVGSSEGFAILDELASLLNGAVGSSRAATNLGWRPHADQIGQTGTRISPELYIACGISGAIQHMVGCKGSKRILAINTDPEAPIVAKSDYAVIGDLHEVIPALISELKNTSGS